MFSSFSSRYIPVAGPRPSFELERDRIIPFHFSQQKETTCFYPSQIYKLNWFFLSFTQRKAIGSTTNSHAIQYIYRYLFVSLLKTKNHLFGNNHFKKCHPEKLGEINIYNSASLHFNVVLII